MHIHVKLFAILKDFAKSSELSLQVPEGSTVGRAKEALLVVEPELRPWIARCAVAVNRAYMANETVLRDGDELALIPPVSGGSR